MNTYLIVKYLHISCAVVSASGFAVRGFWMLIDSPLLTKKLIRVLPHLIDTLLLASAIALVVMSRQYPIVVGWVSIKIVLLLLYIVLGTMALKRADTKSKKRAYFLASLLTVGTIFLVAVFKPGW